MDGFCVVTVGVADVRILFKVQIITRFSSTFKMRLEEIIRYEEKKVE